jgi:hypothetical protein
MALDLKSDPDRQKARSGSAFNGCGSEKLFFYCAGGYDLWLGLKQKICVSERKLCTYDCDVY